MQSLQKLTTAPRTLLLALLLALLPTSPSAAQDYRVLTGGANGVVLDYIGRIAGTHDVLRPHRASVASSSAVLTGIAEDEITAACLLAENATRTIVLLRSADGGRSWTPISEAGIPADSTPPAALSLFDVGRPTVGRRTMRSHLMLLAGGSPITASHSFDGGGVWSRFGSVNDFGGFRVSSLVRLSDGRLMALFHDDGRFLYPRQQGPLLRKSVIYKMYSSDEGRSWTDPEVVLKHNLHGLCDAVAFYSPTRRGVGELILIASFRETGEAVVAVSEDEGGGWSYPVALSSRLHGDRFSVCTLGRELYIAFRDLSPTLDDGTPNPTYGDPVLWTGDTRELLRGAAGGVKVRLADNYPASGPIDPLDLKYVDLGPLSLLSAGPRRMTLIAAGRWEINRPPFLRAIVFTPFGLREAAERSQQSR